MEFKNDVELNGAGRALSEYELSIIEPEETYSTYYKKWIKKKSRNQSGFGWHSLRIWVVFRY